MTLAARRASSSAGTEAGAPPWSSTRLELSVVEQLARAQLWDPADEPVLDDLTDDEEADFVTSVTR